MNNLIKNMIVTTVLSIIMMLNCVFVIMPLVNYELSVSFTSYAIIMAMCLFVFFNFKEVAEKIHLNYKLINTIKILLICFFIFNIIIGLEKYLLIIEISIMLTTIVLSNMISNKMIREDFDGKSTLSMLNYFLIIMCMINILPEMYKQSYNLTIIFLLAMCINRIIYAVVKYKTEERDYNFEDELEKLDEKDKKEKKYKYVNTIGLTFQLLFFVLLWELSLNIWEIPGVSLVNLYFIYLSIIFIILAVKILNINTNLMSIYAAEKIKLLKKFTAIIIQTAIFVLLYVGIQKFIYEGINESLIVLVLLIIGMLVLETIFKFNYATKFGYRWLIFVSGCILVFAQFSKYHPMFEGNTVNYTLTNCFFLVVATILGAIYYAKNYEVEKTKEEFDRVEQLVYTGLIMVAIATLMNVLTFNVSLTVYNAFNTLTGEDMFVFEMPTILGFVLPSIVAALALVSININNPTLKKILVVLKYIAAIYIFYILTEGVKMLSSWDLNSLPNVAVIYAAYLASKGVSVKGKKFVLLIVNVVMYLILVELLFYISELLMIPIDGMSLKMYRIVLSSLIGVLLFAYVYLRNIKINKEDRIFTGYRLLSSSLVVVLLFFGMVSGTTSTITDSLRDKIIEMLLNSGLDIDESLFDEVVYMEVTKDSTVPLYLGDSSGSEYEIGSGWKYDDGDEIINTEDTSVFMKDEFELYDEYFSSKGFNDWYLRDNVKINYPTERLLENNQIMLPTLYTNLKIENEIPASLYEDSRVIVDDYRVGEISFESYTIDYMSPEVQWALREDFVNDYNFTGTNTFVPDVIYDEIEGIKKEINFINMIDEDTNDFDILLYISNYISNAYELDIEDALWEGNENIEECISTKVCNAGEWATLISFVSRSYGIPIRNTKGVYAIGQESTITMVEGLNIVPKMPSLEFEAPSMGWVDGGFLMLGVFDVEEDEDEEDPEEPEDELEDDVLFSFINSSLDANLFLRDSFVLNYADAQTTYKNPVCDEDGSHLTSIFYLEQLLGLSTIETRQIIENNVEDNTVYYAPINNGEITFTNGSDTNECWYENTGTIHSQSTIAKGESYRTTNKSIDWYNENNIQAIKSQFDEPFVIDSGISESFTPSAEIVTELFKLGLIDANIINSYTNNYEKLMYINAVVNSEFRLLVLEPSEGDDVEEVSTPILEGIKDKVITQEQFVVIKASLAYMYGVHTRLASGFYTGNMDVSNITEDYRTLNLEILMPTSIGNQWINLPDRISLEDDEMLNLTTKNIEDSYYIQDSIDISTDIISVMERLFPTEVAITENHYVIKGDTSMYTKLDNVITFVDSGRIEIEFFVFSTTTGQYIKHTEVLEVKNSDIIINHLEYGTVYETEQWNICTEFVTFHEPNKGEDVILPVISLIDAPTGSKPYSACDYQFSIAGEYTFKFEVISSIPSVNAHTEEIQIIVEEVEIDFKISEGYDYENYLAQLNGDSLTVLDGYDTNVCTIVEYFDPVKAIANNGGKMPSSKTYDVITNSNILSPTTTGCMHIFNNPGVSISVMYEVSIDLTTESGIVTRSNNYELPIIVENNEINLEIDNIPSTFYETEAIDFSKYISAAYYNTGHDLLKSDFIITLNQGINNGDQFPVVTLGDSYNMQIEYSKDSSTFGTLQDRIFDTTILKANPEDLSFSGIDNIEIINGKSVSNVAGAYDAKSVLGSNLEYRFVIVSSTAGSGECTALVPCSSSNIEDAINAYFAAGQIGMGRTESLAISVEVVEILPIGAIERIEKFPEEINIVIHSELADITAEPITDTIWDQDKNDYNLLQLLNVNSNVWGINDYINGEIMCYIMSIEVDCSNFNSKNYAGIDSINSEDKLLIFRYEDLKGNNHFINVNFQLKQSVPVVDYNASILSNEFYKNYYYTFCDYVLGYGKDYDGTPITSLDSYEIYVDSKEEGCNRVKLENSGTLQITFILSDRGYSSSVTIDIVVKEQNDKPEIVLPTALLSNIVEKEEKITLANNSITPTNEERVFDFKSDEENDVCSYITAIDKGNGQVLYATEIEVLKNDNSLHELISCRDNAGEVINHSFNDVGEYTFVYFFEDAAGNTVSGEIKVAVIPNVAQENIFSIAATSKYGIIAFQLVGYDNQGYPIYADQFNNLSTNYEFDFHNTGASMDLGDIHTSLYVFEDGKFTIVDSYEFWGKNFYYEYDDERTFDAKEATSTCLLDETVGYYFKSYSFLYKKQGGEHIIIDECGEYTLDEVKTQLGYDHMIFKDLKLREDHSYSFSGFVSTDGFVATSRINEEAVFNLSRVVFYVSLVAGIVSFVCIIYYYLFKKKYEVQFLLDIPKGLEREVVLDDDLLMPSDSVEYRYFKIYYAKLIEKKYKNIIEAYRMSFNKPGITKKQTYHEYMDNILGEDSAFDKEQFLIITNIFTRCRYYEPTVIRKYYLYFNNYYYNFFKDLETLLVTEREKSKIRKLKRW